LSILVLLSFAIPRITRELAAIGMVYASIMFGLISWMMGLVLVWTLWGGWGVVTVGLILLVIGFILVMSRRGMWPQVGLLLLLAGVIPVGMIAALCNGRWYDLGCLALAVVLTWFRRLGLVLAESCPSTGDAPSNVAQGTTMPNDYTFFYSLGGADNELLHRWTDVTDGERVLYGLEADQRAAIQSVLDKHHVSDWSWEKMGMRSVKVVIDPGLTVEITPRERINFLNQCKDPEVLSQAIKAGLIPWRLKGNRRNNLAATDNLIEKIKASATPFERDMADAGFQFVNGSLRNDANTTSMKLDGVERLPRTDHWTMGRDISQSPRGTKTEEMRRAMAGSLEDTGLLKERQDNKAPVLIEDFIEVLNRQVREIGRYAHMAIPARNMTMLLRHPDFVSECNARLGTQWIPDAIERLRNITQLSSGCRVRR
jgi:hypothetical protein